MSYESIARCHEQLKVESGRVETASSRFLKRQDDASTLKRQDDASTLKRQDDASTAQLSTGRSPSTLNSQ